MDSFFNAKRMVAAQKSAFDDFFSSFVAVQELVEKFTRVFYEQAIWFPEEGMRIFDQWTRSCKTGRDQMKATIDRNLHRVIEEI